MSLINQLTKSDIILLVTTLFLGAIALFVPYVSELIKRKFFAPKLIIQFEEKPPWCHKTKLVAKIGNNSLEWPVFYFRFQVKNIGDSQAKKCEAVIEKISIEDASGKFIELANYSPVNLVWGSSNGERETVEINPGRQIFCDLLNIPWNEYQELLQKNGQIIDLEEADKSDLGILLCVKTVFFAQPNRLLPGRYKIEVAIYSENARIFKKTFTISWTGKWKDTELNMFKEIVIE